MSIPPSTAEKNESPKSKGVKIAVCCILFIIAAVVMTITRPPKNEYLSSAPPIWFYNLDTKKLEKQPDKLAPFQSPTGGTLVKAYVFACGDCADNSARFIGWLDRFNDDAKAKLRSNSSRSILMYTGPQGLDSLPEGFFRTIVAPNSYQIRTLTGDWVDAHSDDAEKIRSQARARCGETTDISDCNSADFDPDATAATPTGSAPEAAKPTDGTPANTPEPERE